MTCDLSGANSHWCDGHLGPMPCGICHVESPCSFTYNRDHVHGLPALEVGGKPDA